MLAKLDELDKKAESTLLDQNKLNLKYVLNERLSELLREEEIKWYQRAKVKNLLEGDANTKYFQLVANGKHRKTRIFRLEQEEGLIHGDAELKKYITTYYKKLFEPSDHNNLVMDESYRVMTSLKLQLRKMISWLLSLRRRRLEVQFSK